jgi:hypothetical protein
MAGTGTQGLKVESTKLLILRYWDFFSIGCPNKSLSSCKNDLTIIAIQKSAMGAQLDVSTIKNIKTVPISSNIKRQME